MINALKDLSVLLNCLCGETSGHGKLSSHVSDYCHGTLPCSQVPAIEDITVSQIPQCTCPISHNALFRREMCTFLLWMVHCGIWDRDTWEFVNLVLYLHRADSRFVPSQWETALLCNDVSHWLGTNLESALPKDETYQCTIFEWVAVTWLQHVMAGR